MSIKCTFLAIALAVGATLSLSGCGGHHPPAPQPPADPTTAWNGNPPSPPMPAITWVNAGPFRKAQRSPGDITAIVIHTTEGGYDKNLSFPENQEKSFIGNVNYFKANDRSVSAHFVMGPHGEICNMVNETDIAHTETYYNGCAIGIECAGWANRPEMWTPEMLDSLVNLVAYLCAKWNVPPYHPEGTAYEGPYAIIIDEAANAAPSTDPAAAEKAPKRGPETNRYSGHGLVGHYQVQPWNKSDPGKYFPWEDFTNRVQARLREYNVELAPLPGPEESTNVIFASSKIKEETVTAGQPFTYQLTVMGNGVDTLTPAQITFPDLSEVKGVTAGTPVKTAESTPKRVVFELPMTPAQTGGIALHAARINFHDKWVDSQTVNVKVQ